jgi:hypothetical protein
MHGTLPSKRLNCNITTNIYRFFLSQALRMILQLGVKPSWFECNNTDKVGSNSFKAAPATFGDLRTCMIETALPPIGDSVVPELLLKVLEPYRKEGR